MRIFFPLALLALLIPLPALAHMVIVKQNVNLRTDPSSANPEIRLVTAGEELDLLEHTRFGSHYRIRTRSDDVIGFVYAGSGRLRILASYDRDDWRRWVDDDGDCQKARDEVLIAESEVPVTFKPRDDGRQCKVSERRWTDPFSGEVFTDPGDLDIDHLVPLKNAHVAGAWEWTKARKREYANDLDHPEHLIAVKDSLNQQKGAKGPDQWKPPCEEFWCEYATAWKGIKERWELEMTGAEVEAVEEMKAACRSEGARFYLDVCRLARLDGDGDRVPCEGICR